MSVSMHCRRSACVLVLATGLLSTSGSIGSLQAHGTEARYVELVEWKKEHISRVFGVGTAALGVPGSRSTLQFRMVDNKACVLANVIAFDVDDAYAFDVDEPVTLTLTIAPALSTPFVVGWDQNGGMGVGVTETITPQPGSLLQTITLKLDRARLAGQGTQGSDIAVGSRTGFALCDVAVSRSGATAAPTNFGTLQLTVKDTTGAVVPARIGIYDSTGRAPLASDRALLLQRYADDLRMLPVNDRTFWPSANRQAFYVNGSYDARLPEGTYELVATRGFEYRAYRGSFVVHKDKATMVTIPLVRYADMPGRGWYSGDSHIHLTRDEVADPLVWGMVAAEDVYVGNLLEMGNISGTHFKQPDRWGPGSRYALDKKHFIVSGQEDPRTGHLGHTIHHNLETPVHLDSNNYFFYNRVFEQSHKQGGISGFAHMGSGFNGQRGLALTVPFGLVDFVEVLQAGRLFTDVWYRFLDLGYRISPAAGSDWPYSDFPGVVRNYVKVNGRFDMDAWFESFHAGHVYASNGPLIEFTVNGKQMGEEVKVKRGTRLTIAASARLNPDVDTLNRLELVILSEVTATAPALARDHVELRQDMTAEHSMWIAVRALGDRQDPRNMVVAHSAPIYVMVDDEPSWSAKAVPDLVAYQRAQLQDMMTATLEPLDDLEPWETRDLLLDVWETQRPAMQPKVDEANALYDKLLDRFNRFSSRATSLH
jgi:hypothetical protein